MTETGFTEFIANFELDTQLLMETIDIPNFDIEEILKGIKTDYEPQCNEDEVPELKGESTSKLGDIWILGDHRLMCGDSTRVDSVEKLMNGEKADMVFTDPPYNIAGKTKGIASHAPTNQQNEKLMNFVPLQAGLHKFTF